MSNCSNEKHKILIADDSEMNRDLLSEILADKYEIVGVEDGLQAIAYLEQNSHSVSLLLLDIVMPKADGFEVLAYMNKYHWIDDIPVIMISSETASSYIKRAYDFGVMDYISRPFDISVVQRRVSNAIMLYAKQRKLISIVADQIYEKDKSNNIMISILSHIVEFRNGESGLHVLHINMITEMLLKRLAQKTDRYNLSMADISLISMASALHDIGKIAIPDEILNKPGRLTDEEFKRMQYHTEAGAEMLRSLNLYQDEPLVKFAYEICRWHHERYDGRGYPDGLVGDDIPIAAQIVAVADVYDALTSERCYKKAYSHDVALQMIANGECGSFNALVLECLEDISEELRREMQINSPDHKASKEIQELSAKMQRYEELSASTKMLWQLEFERVKSQFFVSELSGLAFVYQIEPPILTLSRPNSLYAGMSEAIIDPFHDAQFEEYIQNGEQLIDIITENVHQTTMKQSSFQVTGLLKLNGVTKLCCCICRAIWVFHDQPRYMGVVGRIIELGEQDASLKVE